jgi:hypothetical protein
MPTARLFFFTIPNLNVGMQVIGNNKPFRPTTAITTYYRILTRQGSNVPGGKYNYIINGNLITGFALVAFPAQYGSSGIMTFVVNHQGKIFQKDLGAQNGRNSCEDERVQP